MASKARYVVHVEADMELRVLWKRISSMTLRRQRSGGRKVDSHRLF